METGVNSDHGTVATFGPLSGRFGSRVTVLLGEALAFDCTPHPVCHRLPQQFTVTTMVLRAQSASDFAWSWPCLGAAFVPACGGGESVVWGAGLT